MKKFDVVLKTPLDTNQTISQFRRVIREELLTLKSEGTLKTIPGSVHWHIIKPDKKGTLEATFDISKNQLWLCYHDNRYADWIDEAVTKIKKKFAALLEN